MHVSEALREYPGQEYGDFPLERTEFVFTRLKHPAAALATVRSVEQRVNPEGGDDVFDWPFLYATPGIGNGPSRRSSSCASTWPVVRFAGPASGRYRR